MTCITGIHATRDLCSLLSFLYYYRYWIVGHELGVVIDAGLAILTGVIDIGNACFTVINDNDNLCFAGMNYIGKAPELLKKKNSSNIRRNFVSLLSMLRPRASVG
jgi:hypothetical protein